MNQQKAKLLRKTVREYRQTPGSSIEYFDKNPAQLTAKYGIVDHEGRVKSLMKRRGGSIDHALYDWSMKLMALVNQLANPEKYLADQKAKEAAFKARRRFESQFKTSDISMLSKQAQIERQIRRADKDELGRMFGEEAAKDRAIAERLYGIK